MNQNSPESDTPVTMLGRHWRSALLGGLVGSVLFAGLTLLQRRTYTAEMLLTTVESASGAGKLSGAAVGLLSLARGFEATPALVNRLSRMNSVLEEVADAPVTTTRGSVRVIEAAFPKEQIGPAFRARAMEKLVRTSVDRESGIISLRVSHSDSALARRVAQLLVTSVRKAFARVSRAQATELRLAQEQRVAVAAENLRVAEENVPRFVAANRIVTDYSALQVQRRRLDRAAQIAQNVYMQAVSDRESAVSKELENAPALVVVDDIPSVMVPDSRHALIKTIFGGMLGILLFLLYQYWRKRQSAV